MPNYCENLLEITGEEKRLEELRNFIKSDKGNFDFNKVIPYPEEFAEADERYAKMSLEEKMKEKKVSDGFNNGGYEWCCKNWGTKWNVCWGQVGMAEKLIDENSYSLTIDFDTAWSPSLPITKKLSELFPDLLFTHKYEEGGVGFSGYTVFDKGEVINNAEGEYDDYPISDHSEFNEEE